MGRHAIRYEDKNEPVDNKIRRNVFVAMIATLVILSIAFVAWSLYIGRQHQMTDTTSQVIILNATA